MQTRRATAHRLQPLVRLRRGPPGDRLRRHQLCTGNQQRQSAGQRPNNRPAPYPEASPRTLINAQLTWLSVRTCRFENQTDPDLCRCWDARSWPMRPLTMPVIVTDRCPVTDPATERRKPSLCRVGTASARARTPFRFRDGGRSTKCGRICLMSGRPSGAELSAAGAVSGPEVESRLPHCLVVSRASYRANVWSPPCVGRMGSQVGPGRSPRSLAAPPGRGRRARRATLGLGWRALTGFVWAMGLVGGRRAQPRRACRRRRWAEPRTPAKGQRPRR